MIWRLLWLVVLLSWIGVLIYSMGQNPSSPWISDFRDGILALLLLGLMAQGFAAWRRRAAAHG